MWVTLPPDIHNVNVVSNLADPSLEIKFGCPRRNRTFITRVKVGDNDRYMREQSDLTFQHYYSLTLQNGAADGT